MSRSQQREEKPGTSYSIKHKQVISIKLNQEMIVKVYDGKDKRYKKFRVLGRDESKLRGSHTEALIQTR